jgi:alpha-beta hydrolase superfamily lysophospholipase
MMHQWILGRDGSARVASVFFRMWVVWVLVATSGCAWLNEQQRLIIYRPTPSTTLNTDLLPPVTALYFLDVPQPGAPAHLALWWLPQADRRAPTLLYLHGTFRDLQGNLHKINALHEAGFSVLAVDYRGWGQSTPLIPSEETILQDARLAWAELMRREPRPAQRVIYGHSMGSGVAVDLASHLQAPSDFGGLILESAFTSFAEVASQAGFWPRVLSLLIQERFASIEKISQVRAPLLMLHGDQDSTIPLSLGRQLFEAANPPKQWVEIAGGQHSDLNLVAREKYQAALAAFKATYLSQP